MQSLYRSTRKVIKQACLGTLDIFDSSARRREMIPPRTKIYVGDGDYKAVGQEFLHLFTKYGGLTPEDKVLDVGSGTGRMAVPLTGYLKNEYQGFEIVKEGVQWCQENISSRYKNFHFTHADIRNEFYNPHGKYEAENYRFPYNSGEFDFVFLTSVFTHMYPDPVENYLGEIVRVLKAGGTCFITMFLLNDESTSLIKRGKSSQNFIHELNGCFTANPEIPEGSLAFTEEYVRRLFDLNGLTIKNIHRGSWCGRERFLSYQDVIVATR
ncbi:MAG TPA: class I SAM-dependent methyltransferase [Edaphobacter sp.]|jgi:SAM-dependent methyltransferase